MQKKKIVNKISNNKGITLIALIITILFFYDYGSKCRNDNSSSLFQNC